jgi:hypothetical protein
MEEEEIESKMCLSFLCVFESLSNSNPVDKRLTKHKRILKERKSRTKEREKVHRLQFLRFCNKINHKELQQSLPRIWTQTDTTSE